MKLKTIIDRQVYMLARNKVKSNIKKECFKCEYFNEEKLLCEKYDIRMGNTYIDDYSTDDEIYDRSIIDYIVGY